MGVSNLIEPRYSVAVQLKVFTAEGTATSMVRIENTALADLDDSDFIFV